MPAKIDSQFEQPSQGLLAANKYLWAILLVVVLLIFVAGYFFILSPSFKKATEAKEAAVKISANEQEVNNLIQQVSDLEKDFNKAKTERAAVLTRLQKIIPNSPEIAELFVLSEQLALNRGLILESVDFSEVVASNQASVAPLATSESSSTPPVVESSLAGIAINMTVKQGGAINEETTDDNVINIISQQVGEPYDVFKQYLDDLESNLRLIDVESVSFSSGELGELSMTFTMKTYFLKK